MKSEWRAPKSTSVTGSNFGWTYVTLDRASQVARVGKQEIQEMQVQSLGQEDPLEEGMAIHSSFWPGESHEQRSLAGYSP